MLILHRYVLTELLSPFGVGLFAFTFVLILHYLFLMMDLFLNRGVGLLIVLKMVALVFPMFLPLSLPMAALLAALIAYGRLSEDGELTALRSSGCSLFHYGFPSILFGLFLSLLLVFFNLAVAPRSHQAFKDLYYSVIQRNPISLFAPKVLNHFGEYKVIVDKMDRKKRKLEGIGIYKMNPEGTPTRILAPEGILDSNAEDGITLELRNGSVHQPSAEKGNEYTITKFNRLAIRIPSRQEGMERKVTPREMSWSELKQKIRESEESRQNPAPWQTENHLRIAVAFAPLFFVLLGVGLGIRFKRGSKAVGIGMSLIVILVYYGGLMLAVPISSQGTLPPILLTWFPNAVMLLAGAHLVWKVSRQ
ncbi:MAG: LptF/LptG family permease [Elusimicrobia bacterium]|nr:LptF/LptG family permease [Elusimicrobiota bacterium]